MLRRDFLKLSGAALATALLPPVDHFISSKRDYSLFSDYYNSLWWNKKMQVKSVNSTLVQFNRLIENSIADSRYVRCVKPVKAAWTVTEQDIVDEINAKWKYPDETKIITCGSEVNFGFNNWGRFHPTIGSVKRMIERISDNQLSEVGKSIINKRGIHGYMRHTVTLDENFVVHTTKMFKYNKTIVSRQRIYDIESFAKEMVSSRDDRSQLAQEIDEENYWLAVEANGYDNVNRNSFMDYDRYKEIRRIQRERKQAIT